MTTQASIEPAIPVAQIPATPASSSATTKIVAPAAVASHSASGSTPMTLAITLTPSPSVVGQWYVGIPILVAVLTLLGVWMSLKAAGKRTQNELAAAENRMRIELDQAAAQATLEREQTREQAALDRQHDADEAHRERITTARRTVYLEAIGELVRTQAFLGGLAKQDLTKIDVSEGVRGLLTAVARIGILGGMATVTKSRALASLINQVLLKGVATVMPLSEFKGSITFHDGRYAATQSEIARILAAMTHHNETLKNDRPGFDALQRSFEIQQAAAKQHSAKSIEAQLALADGQKEYAAALMEDIKIIANCLDELACAIREELGLEASLEEFQRMTATMQKEAAAAMQEFFGKVDAFRKEADRPE